MPNKKIIETLSFTLSSSGGDGAYLCVEKITLDIFNYFKKNNLDLERFALDENYATTNKIPKKLYPFTPGSRAEFGSYECGMSTDDDLELTVETEDYEEIFSGTIPKKNVKKAEDSDLIKKYERGFYAVGYEGLEDCYISGELELDSEFDINKFKISYVHIDYKISSRKLISSITYDSKNVDWSMGSYEGTGDNSFEFLEIK
jgi:hypothetical protein